MIFLVQKSYSVFLFYVSTKIIIMATGKIEITNIHWKTLSTSATNHVCLVTGVVIYLLAMPLTSDLLLLLMHL